MAKTRYLTMKGSAQVDAQGKSYPDVVSNPINTFETQDPPEHYTIQRKDIMRIDLLMYQKYRYAYYDDVILDFNGIGSIHLLEPGDEILLPSKRDLDNYFARNLQRKQN